MEKQKQTTENIPDLTGKVIIITSGNTAQLFSFLVQEPAQGALLQIRACADENVNGAEYYGPDGLLEMVGDPEKAESSKDSHNKEHARKLWEVSEKLTGVKYF